MMLPSPRVHDWLGCKLLSFALLLVSPGYRAEAEPVADFYRDRTITMVIGYSAGGGYDLYARVLARHMGRHIPGHPRLLPQNMPGAGSLKAANFVYSLAPRDGTVIATATRGMATDPLLGDSKFDPMKFIWIGSITSETSVCATWHTSPVKTWADVFTKDFTMGGSATGSETDSFALLLRNVFGAKMKLITGYPGGNDINLAMERGEVDGRCGWSWSSIKSQKASWLEQKSISLLVQLGMEKHPDLPHVPMLLDFASTLEQRQVLKLVLASLVLGRPIFAPPEIPEDRSNALRAAFDATMRDPQFLDEAAKLDLEISPVPAAAINDLLSELYRTSKSAVEKAAAAIQK
jgi:tripartite-type tricarboxylate transporter receptor subunit TctC